jgi:hypothetical protein
LPDGDCVAGTKSNADEFALQFAEANVSWLAFRNGRGRHDNFAIDIDRKRTV